ncbi:MAG: hypothetical protein EOO91_18885, partial [Pedobacter sp.]
PEKSKATAPVQQEVPQQKEKQHTAPKAKTIKRDKVKFPPPVVKPSGNDRFSPMYRKDKETGKPILSETRLIVINGKPVEDITKFYGVYNAHSIVYRTKQGSLAKYGEKGKDGAVEITGADIKYFTVVTLPSAPPVEPPPPRQDKVRFPPPIVKNEKQVFFPTAELDQKSGRIVITEKRYILINDIPVGDNNKFYGIRNIDRLMFLKPSEAIKKYGNKADNGAVIIQGKELAYFKQAILAPKQDQVKFPPPIVKPAKRKIKSPPAVEPPPAAYKTKTNAPRIVRGPVLVNQFGVLDSGIIVLNNKVIEPKGRKIKNLNAESITYYPKDKPTAIELAIKRFGPKAKNGVMEIIKGTLEFEN